MTHICYIVNVLELKAGGKKLFQVFYLIPKNIMDKIFLLHLLFHFPTSSSLFSVNNLRPAKVFYLLKNPLHLIDKLHFCAIFIRENRIQIHY